MTVRQHGIEVDPAALDRHAIALEQITDRVRLGQDAARAVRLDTEAYGKLCQALPTMIEPLHDLADRVLAEAQTALSESGYALRAAARHYTASDSSAADRLNPP